MVRTFAYTYDAAGQLTQATDVASTYGYAYDGLGRVMSESQSFAGFSPLIQYNRQFNAAGRVTTLAAIVGGTADFENTYVYDNLQRLTSLRQQGVYEGHAVAEKRADFSYNAAGQFMAISRFADVAGTELVANSFYAYDGMGRLASLIHSEDSSPPTSGWGSGILAGYLYAYDAGSRITSIDSYGDDLSEFTYDATSQLVAADHTGQADEAYEYDENGNRTQGDYTVESNNRMSSDGTYDYTYDAEGNRLTRTHIASGYVTLYSWDHRNRLVGVTEQDDEENVLSTVQYAYNAFNQRIAKIIDADGPGGSGPTSSFFSWESDQIVLQFDGGTTDDLSHRYFYGPAIDQVLMDEQLPLPVGEGRGEGEWSGHVLHLLADHLGTIRDLAEYDAGQSETTIANHRTFDSFGNITAETNSATGTLFAFTGRELDPEIGLQYHRARYYDPATGRWISEDPIGLADDSNLARFVHNNALNRVDPTGHQQQTPGPSGTSGAQQTPLQWWAQPQPQGSSGPSAPAQTDPWWKIEPGPYVPPPEYWPPISLPPKSGSTSEPSFPYFPLPVGGTGKVGASGSMGPSDGNFFYPFGPPADSGPSGSVTLQGGWWLWPGPSGTEGNPLQGMQPGSGIPNTGFPSQPQAGGSVPWWKIGGGIYKELSEASAPSPPPYGPRPSPPPYFPTPSPPPYGPPPYRPPPPNTPPPYGPPKPPGWPH